MPFAVKVCVVALLLFSAVNGEFDVEVDFDLEEATTLNWEDLEDSHGRALQQAGVRPCRWNIKFQSCDFNYDYVARIVPTTPAARAARQWFINSKVCDSPAYQASAARCQADNAHFCKWTGGVGCTSILQPFYNYYLACPGSVAKAHFLCTSKFTQANCRAPTCRWVAPAGRAPYCTRAPRFTAVQEARYNGYLNSANLAAFRGAWGVCDGSNTAYNQTFCSKQTTRALCTRSRYCSYAVFSNRPVCYTNNVWSPVFLYQNDASFKYLLRRCAQGTKAACEGTAAGLTANNG